MEVDNKEKILDLFFNKHLKQVEIAKIVGVKKQYASRIVKADSRYEEAKANKLKESAVQRKEYLKIYNKTYKRPKQDDNSYEQMQEQLKQDSLELSYYNGGISDYAFAN